MSLDINELSFKQFWPLPSFNHVRRGVQKSPFWAKNDQTWQGRWCPEVVYEGPKWSKMINITYFWPFGAILDPFGLFGSFQTKLDFLPQNRKVLLSQSELEQKIKFCPKSSKRVQMGPKWPQMVKNMLYWSFWIILDPRRPLRDISDPAMFGHFWPKKGFFWTPLRTWLREGKGQNCFKLTSYMSKDYACATDA